MSHVATRAGPSTVTPSDGSRTVVLHDTQPREGEENRNDVSSVLHLRGAPRTHPRVTWTEDVVDNEGMGKKKSKICCIYHKRRRFDESSSESESSDSDSGRAQPGGRLGQHRDHHHSHRSHPHPHPDPQNSESSGNEGGQAMQDGGGSVTVQELPDKCEPNAYERQPGKRKRGTVLNTDE